ncbi:NAD(P)-dependent dehydrogenase (short-subunit alcohol dehydrogenase family) [Amycolatopsis bartoniae]|uniref:2-deoxy-D-gluconate 3-dehydrogenase n=1 Tax=Amycolatopsis bartoniae TaxID=941986 RepID=A0A8H9IT72_9PSEU|nr:SDR family oxidoreductase [Amycolatopsis bartoniae]MBB2940259.1 NAD(P)-dependent dehydrogenase (short-subunit alcohol dehydrogenase family) [Amycolatopsis bartoniae]TVT10162.1 SDR family oxidoreductase [Amycolatopsis bartoniae]GHF35224.1 2-deoxy-D-gluconate 3-dehydrogenase [Amycolatopsis bartoniae]
MAGRLTGKVALVTGIGAGMGRQIALRFADEGAEVLGCDINAEAAERTVEQAAGNGTPIESVHPVDLTRPADVRRWVRIARDRFGKADILVNAGAIAPRTAPAGEMDFETEWRPTIAGEVDLVFLACNEAWPLLKASGRASIINFASVNATRGSMKMAMLAHCAGKGAVRSMTKQLAVEGGPLGIRANTIAPGLVESAMTAEAGAIAGENVETVLSRSLLGRIGTPDDIAWCALYLASDEASWVTGADFAIDGGVTAV